VPPPPGHLRALRELTAKRGILLILDEIQTGIGRTGPLFAYQAEDVLPDILTVGKGLGAGFPVAAVLARESVAVFEPGDQGGTFPGNPLACAVALAVLREVTGAGFLERAAVSARALRTALEDLAKKHHCRGVEGRGHLLALSLPLPHARDVASAAFERGLLVNAARPDRLRVMPALTTSESEISQMHEWLDAALSSALSSPSTAR
jgi:acetylornithine/N-succinyldiaminopimelate aminotransferase